MSEVSLAKAPRNLRGTWPQALSSLAGALLLILAIRWALVEPYVIPSESMLPTLLVHDHIFVNKFAYGLRLPFTNRYLIRFSKPNRGDVIVFRSVEDSQVFLVKRVVGLPGDEIEMKSDGLFVNGALQKVAPLDETALKSLLKDWLPANAADAEAQYTISTETLSDARGDFTHPVFRDRANQIPDFAPVKVPADHYFMSGDNRDHSADSRTWGTLPFDSVLGRASIIWLSCEEAMVQSGQLCNPQTMRWSRLFTGVR